jgi:hypothetical protein
VDQNPKGASTLEMDISYWVDTLRMLEDIRKETQKCQEIAKTDQPPGEITLFGANHSNTNGIVTLIQEHPEHEEWI